MPVMPSRQSVAHKHHPLTTDRLRSTLARWPLWLLIALFIALYLLIAFLFSFLDFFICFLNSADGDDFSFKSDMLILFTNHLNFLLLSSVLEPSLSIFPCLLPLRLLESFTAIALPAFLFGATVFRLLIRPNVFVFRKKISFLEAQHESPTRLAVRFYNSSSLEIVNLRAKVIARFSTTNAKGDKILRNSRLNVVRMRAHVAEELDENYFPVLLPHRPFTIYVPIRETDLPFNEDSAMIGSIQGIKFEDVLENKLLIMLDGYIPLLGQQITEIFEYSLSNENIHYGPFSSITPKYQVPARLWRGWKSFER